ncbi:hypothetical protein [Humibacter sp.]|uniref:hypothetical protein n=1 Tax=Humibacter sp. TaxID=1940291 RepID=UPI002B7C96DE|nr:hypothetical protein [Humibacter sp.]HVX09148.1 hypothetical protein [Humibacter sp.]
MDVFASGLTKMSELAAEFPEPGVMNEATTRLQVVDRILTECLRWPLSQIECETPEGGEYADYSIGRPAVAAILEAKREGTWFAIPAGVDTRRSVDIETLMADAETGKAIEQVLGYCQRRGVPIAVLCNGHQLIAFFASRQDGVPPRKGRALVFPSLRSMEEGFKILWSHLSPGGIAERNLQRALLGRSVKPAPPPKLSDEIFGYPGFRQRSARETDLKILGGIFIQDLESEETVSEAFLRECYCNTGALSQYALVSKEILRARYAGVGAAGDVEVETATRKGGVNPRLRMTADVMAAAMSRRPLIILGDVGVGKSMFLRHLIRVDAAEVLDSSLVFYVDFGKEPALTSHLESYVERRIREQLEHQRSTSIADAGFIRATYNRELNQFKRGIYGDLERDDPAEFRRREISLLEDLTADGTAHLRRSLEHIRATENRAAVIVLDNIDQRPPEFQERVFLIAQSLAETWPATVFVALRPKTFYDSRSRGSLAAYQPRVFAVTPTRVDEVVRRRLAFAVRRLDDAEAAGGFPENLTLDSSDLRKYLKVLEKAFKGETELNSLLENLSGGNLRLALTLLASFVGSGYVSTQRILDVAAEGRTYVIPTHEFLRSVIFGDYEFYDPAASEICNLFDITADDGGEHFLMPMLLAYVQRSGEAAGAEGFVSSSSLYELGQSLGFTQEQVGSHIQRAIKKRLLDSADEGGAGGPYRITSAGSYSYRRLIRDFTYVDAMVVDTPIVDVAVRAQIRDVRGILERLDRADLFIKYLDDQWKTFGDTEALPFDWAEARNALVADVAGARERALRAEARRRDDDASQRARRPRPPRRQRRST